MKKVMFLFALIMGFAFSMNAQVSYDTIINNGERVMYANDTIVDTIAPGYNVAVLFSDTTSEWDSLTVTIDHAINVQNTRMYFTIEGLTEDEYIGVYAGDMVYSHFPVYDTIFNFDTIFTFDTIYDTLTSNYFVDTIVTIDTIFDSIYSFQERIFNNETYDFMLDELIGDDDSVLHSIGFSVFNDSIGDSISTNPVYMSNIYLIETLIDTSTSGIGNMDYSTRISLYPNPTSNIVYLNGNYKTLVVSDFYGHRLAKFKNNEATSFDLRRLNKGVYMFTFNNCYTIKVIKD